MRTIFLDRDGVINRKRTAGQYVTSWEEFEFLPRVGAAIRALNSGGYRVIVVTNQRGVALGMMPRSAVDDIHAGMLRALEDAGARIDLVLVCPHEIGVCDCRKPRPGLFHAAAKRYADLDLAASAVVGDSSSDVEAARTIGAAAYLVTSDADRRAARRDDADVAGTGIDLLDIVMTYLLPAAAASHG